MNTLSLKLKSGKDNMDIFEKTIVISTKDVTAYKNKIPFDTEIEQLYQAFKQRLLKEIKVNSDPEYGGLIDIED